MLYTGIGSRQTPKNILDQMYAVAQKLSSLGYTLRSGKAQGADSVFQLGAQKAGGNAEIYVPWYNFSSSNKWNPDAYQLRHSMDILCNETQFAEAEKIAKSVHPNWARCSGGAKRLHTRNVFQVLGPNLDTPSQFVLYWAPIVDGVIQGGTHMATSIAQLNNIPVIRVGEEGWKDKLATYITPQPFIPEEVQHDNDNFPF